MDKILLGTTKEHGKVYLSRHTWECEWYWGMGYLGNKNCHFHMDSLLKEEHDVSKIFEETKLTQKDWWIIRDLFIQAYALKKVAEVYRHGGHQTSVKGITDKIKDKSKADIINDDLLIILDTVWDYINNAIDNSK